jgi:hypothetical protein
MGGVPVNMRQTIMQEIDVQVRAWVESHVLGQPFDPNAFGGGRFMIHVGLPLTVMITAISQDPNDPRSLNIAFTIEPPTDMLFPAGITSDGEWQGYREPGPPASRGRRWKGYQ